MQPKNAIISKATWGDGPWQSEPDRAEWRDEATGLPCLAVRHSSAGHWCGYVGVAPGHSWHGKDYDQCTEPTPCDDTWCSHSAGSRADVHGGLTYAKACHGNVCHVPAPGEPDDVWWFGFDCAHSGDLSPAHTWARSREWEEYRDLDYVRGECARLAQQVKAAA